MIRQKNQWTYLHCIQISCFGRLQKPVVHVRVTCGNIFWKRERKKKSCQRRTHIHHVMIKKNSVFSIFLKVRSAVITVEDLLHSFVAHLSSGEALQRHNGGVGPVTQQQLAGLDVTSQRRSMKSCLTQSVHSIDLESERKRFLSFIPTTLPKTTFFQKGNAKAHLCSMFLQHLKDIIVSSLGSDVQRGHEAKRRHRWEHVTIITL